MRTITLISCLCFLFPSLWGQPDVPLQELLTTVKKNNKTLQARQQWQGARQLEAYTDIYLNNPGFEFDYLYGTQGGLPPQTEMYLTEQFDFPTTYFHKKNRAQLQAERSQWAYRQTQQQVLLEVQRLGYKLIYLQKKEQLCHQWYKQSRQLYESMRAKFRSGEVDRIALSKSRLYQLKMENKWQGVQRQLDASRSELKRLNGGNEIQWSDTTYPAVQELPSLDTIIARAIKHDPELQRQQYHQQVSERTAAVEKSLSLPKLEVGYRNQTVGNSRYDGALVGITIPLWEHKNRVKAARAQSVYYQDKVASRQQQLRSMIRKSYQKASDLQENLREFRKALEKLHSQQWLQQALKAGELSVPDYYREIIYYQDTRLSLLEMEHSYYRTLAKLYQHWLGRL